MPKDFKILPVESNLATKRNGTNSPYTDLEPIRSIQGKKLDMTVRQSKNKLATKNDGSKSLIKVANNTAVNSQKDLIDENAKKVIGLQKKSSNMLNVASAESLTQIYQECFDDKSDSYIQDDSHPGSFGPSPGHLSPIHHKIPMKNNDIINFSNIKPSPKKQISVKKSV